MQTQQRELSRYTAMQELLHAALVLHIQQLLFTSCANAFHSADFFVCTLSAVTALITHPDLCCRCIMQCNYLLNASSWCRFTSIPGLQQSPASLLTLFLPATPNAAAILAP